MDRTPRLKKMMENAYEIAYQRTRHMIGTEHVLLALMNETESIASEALRNLGVTPERLLAEVDRLAPVRKACSHCDGTGRA